MNRRPQPLQKEGVVPAAAGDAVRAASTDRRFTNLRHLPDDHPLRNTLLLDLGAEFKHPAWTEFRPIEAGRPLADNTYNTLSRGWTDFYQWRIPAEKGSS